jgi:hypothetical protein
LSVLLITTTQQSKLTKLQEEVGFVYVWFVGVNKGERIMGIQLTVYFDAPFWVGVFERSEAGKLETARVVFGAEPKDYEVCEYIRMHFNRLVFSPPLETEEIANRRINPKRLQRKIRREVSTVGIGTKAQQALQLEREAVKEARRVKSKADRAARQEEQFALRQAKKKEKKTGH